VKLADMQDPTQPRTLCTLTVNSASGLRFINQGELSYVALAGSGQDAAGGLVRLNLATGATGLLARWDQSHFGAGIHAWTPDGKTLAYVASTASSFQLHQVTAAGDRVLTSLPAVPGRGTSEEDSLLLAYSPDGQYLTLDNTFTGSGTGEQARLQIRRLDGSLAFAAAGGTHATWAGSGATLFWREVANGPSSPPLQKWTPAGAGTAVPGLKWLRPSASPDGRYIAYTIRSINGLAHAGIYDLQGGSPKNYADNRSSTQFVSTTAVWYQEERPCQPADNCLVTVTKPTGKTFIYDVKTQKEFASSLPGILAVHFAH
jgi:Tol biopolymer transport system component